MALSRAVIEALPELNPAEGTAFGASTAPKLVSNCYVDPSSATPH